MRGSKRRMINKFNKPLLSHTVSMRNDQYKMFLLFLLTGKPINRHTAKTK